MRWLIAIFILGSIIFAGCIDQIREEIEKDLSDVEVPEISEKYCTKDDDCGCGIHKTREECFYGNKKYVDMTKNCPDFCSGLSGNLELRCINFECTQVQAER